MPRGAPSAALLGLAPLQPYCFCLFPALQHAVALTALEVARGLEYLHHPDRRMVHRDLSAANVLLTTSTSDARGFRALLSDFGAWLQGGTSIAWQPALAWVGACGIQHAP